jgi:hypothetical protein
VNGGAGRSPRSLDRWFTPGSLSTAATAAVDSRERATAHLADRAHAPYCSTAGAEVAP